MVYCLLYNRTYRRSLEQLCSTCRQEQVRIQGLPKSELRHRSRMVRLYHVVGTGAYGWNFIGEASKGKLREILGHSPFVHCVLHLLVRPWRILHDQAGFAPIL